MSTLSDYTFSHTFHSTFSSFYVANSPVYTCLLCCVSSNIHLLLLFQLHHYVSMFTVVESYLLLWEYYRPWIRPFSIICHTGIINFCVLLIVMICQVRLIVNFHTIMNVDRYMLINS